MFRPFQSIWFRVLAGFAVVTVPLHGQTQSQPPALKRVSDTAPIGQQQNTPDVTTIRTFSNLVVIDVVVTGSDGKPVHGLTKDAFTLLENNKEQLIRHFEEHSAVPASDARIAPAPKLPPGLFSNRSAAPANGPVNVLLLDYLNTPLTAQPFARKQLLDFLDHAPPGTRIAIFGLTSQLSMLQGFTSDVSVLKAALTGSKGAPQASELLDDPLNGGVGDTTLSSGLDNPAVAGSITQAMVDSITRFEALRSSDVQTMRQQYTLNAFDLLARYLVGIPGRKNVIWFSGGFPLNIEPNTVEADPNDSVVRNDDEVRKTDNLLTRAQIAVYPVDARGLMVNPGNTVVSEGPPSPDSEMNFRMEVAQEHETMEMMAEDTGGQAYYNSNGLRESVASAVQNGSNYYTLTYSPMDTQWDSRFRAVKVKVNHPGVKLAYRNGYFAVDPNDRSKLVAGLAATALAQPTTMATAMMHGGPNPSEILFKVRIRPADTPPEDAPLATNQKNPDPKVKIEGPYKAYGVDLVPDAKAVSCRQDAAGNRHCALEVWTFVYNSDGERLITVSNRLHTLLKPEEYERMVGTPEKPGQGIAFHQEISVPVKGQYFLRTAIHDMVSDRVGAVEVPVSAVARLEPLKSVPVAADSQSAPAPQSAPQ